MSAPSLTDAISLTTAFHAAEGNANPLQRGNVALIGGAVHMAKPSVRFDSARSLQKQLIFRILVRMNLE